MKFLFSKDECYNEDGGKVSTKLMEAINPIMEKLAKEGYRVKDIEAIAIDVIIFQSTSIRAKKLASSAREKRD